MPDNQELIPLADGPAVQLLAPGLNLAPISPASRALAERARELAACRARPQAEPGPLFAPIQPDMFG